MNRKPINNHPEYEIGIDGIVWRVEPTKYADKRFGPVPRPIKPVMMGGAIGNRYPHVKLGGVKRANRSILSLMKEHWPELESEK